MRRLPTLTVFFLVFALLALTPVAAAPAETGAVIEIAVPDYIPTDGELDRVVLAGGASEIVEVSNCFPAGSYPRVPVVVIDKTAKTTGRMTGVLVTVEYEPGTRAENLVFNGICTEPDGTSYRKYIGVIE